MHSLTRLEMDHVIFWISVHVRLYRQWTAFFVRRGRRTLTLGKNQVPIEGCKCLPSAVSLCYACASARSPNSCVSVLRQVLSDAGFPVDSLIEKANSDSAKVVVTLCCSSYRIPSCIIRSDRVSYLNAVSYSCFFIVIMNTIILIFCLILAVFV